MDRTKKIISLVLVFQWVVATSTILILVVIGAMDSDKGMDFLKSYSAVTSGFVGIVIGYLFSAGNE